MPFDCYITGIMGIHQAIELLIPPDIGFSRIPAHQQSVARIDQIDTLNGWWSCSGGKVNVNPDRTRRKIMGPLVDRDY